LDRAFNYPYRRPRCSFIMVAGKFFELDATPELADYRNQKLHWKDLKVREFIVPDKAESNASTLQGDVYMDCVGVGPWMDLASVAAQLNMPLTDVFHKRIPVLAIGSNAGLEQLTRKFGNDAVIPVLMIRLEDFDIAYCPTISAYGSVPATIQRAPGVHCDIAITLLSEEQVGNMHKTEAGYDYVMFDNVPVWLKQTSLSDIEAPLLSPIPSPVFVYVESQGILTLEGAHIPLREIPGMNRKQPGLPQKDVQRVIYSFCHQDPDYLKILVDMGISVSCFTSPLADLDWRQIPEEEVEKFVLNNINIGPKGRRRVRMILMKHHGLSFMDIKQDPAETKGQVYELLQRLHHPPDQDD